MLSSTPTQHRELQPLLPERPLDFKLTPLAGTTSTLEIINIPLLQGSVIFGVDNLEPWNPRDFRSFMPHTCPKGYLRDHNLI